MIGVNETAYPRLKSHPTAKELASIYTPSADEVAFANSHARRPAPRTGFLILLKTFQRLGYFSRLVDVPPTIINHIAKTIGFEKLPNGLDAYDDSNARLRHLNLILSFLSVTPYDKAAEAEMITAVTETAATKDDLADIINVAIEELVRQRYELPSFATILRAAKKARVTINACYHKLIYHELGKDGRKKIDALLVKRSRNIKSCWDRTAASYHWAHARIHGASSLAPGFRHRRRGVCLNTRC